jgi:hypothetical protein
LGKLVDFIKGKKIFGVSGTLKSFQMTLNFRYLPKKNNIKTLKEKYQSPTE